MRLVAPGRTTRAMLLLPRTRDDLHCTGVFAGQSRPDLMLRRTDTPLANCEVECVHARSRPCVATRHTVQHLSQTNITRRRQRTRLATRGLPQRVLVLRTLQAQTRRTQRRARDQRNTLTEQARCTPRRAEEPRRTRRLSQRQSGNKSSHFLWTPSLRSNGFRVVPPRVLELPHQLQRGGLSRCNT